MIKVTFQKPSWQLVAKAPFGKAPEAGLRALEAQGVEEPLGLYGLVLELNVDSETPVVKLLESQPTVVNIDKLKRRRYLLSGSLQAFRNFYLEYKEQKVAKALLLFLCEEFPSFFKDLWPKHGLLPPLGVSFRALSPEEVQGLELSIRLRHHYALTRFRLPRGEALSLFLTHQLQPVFTAPAKDKVWVLPEEVSLGGQEGLDRYLECWLALPEEGQRALAPQVVACEGLLFAPLLAYMAIFTRTLATASHPLAKVVRELLVSFKENFPEPFGLLPE